MFGAAWAVFTPPWQAPDEPAHYGYVESLAQRHAFPGSQAGNVYSSAQQESLQASNGEELSKITDGRPQWSDAPTGQLITGPSSQRSDNGGGESEGRANTARSNPPGYYVAGIVPYATGSLIGGTPARLYVMRLASVALLLVAVGAIWLLLGELFGRSPLLQLAGAGTAGLAPMMSFISSSVTPDALLVALWSLALWLGARIVRRGLSARDGVAFGAVLAGALLTKGTSYALIPAGIFVLIVGARRAGGYRVAALTAAIAAVPAVAWVVIARLLDRPAVNQVGAGGTGQALTDQGFSLGQIASYLWQFYLPRLSSQTDFATVRGVPLYDVWVKDIVGRFGWLQIEQPGWLYVAGGVAIALVVVAGAWALIADRAALGLPVLVFIALVVAGLVAGLHAVDYRVGIQQGMPFMQGRYLLPLAGVFAVLVAACLKRIPAAARAPATATLLGVLVAWQLISFGQAAGYWYV